MARDNSRGPRLDQPMERGLSLRPSVDQEAVGRLSERIARFLGSWRFIGYMTAFVLFWVLWNTIGPKGLRFDEWPFIGLTLLLSLQASYAAPLILLAQNRQSDRDRIQYQDDRSNTERLIADTEYLMREIASLRVTPDLLREVIDSFHPLLGLLVAQRWNLPPEFGAILYFHHNPAATPHEEWTPMVHTVALANLIAKVEGFGLYDVGEMFLTSDVSARYLNMNDIKLAGLRVDLADTLEPLFQVAGAGD